MATVCQHERPAVWQSAVGKTAIAASLVLTQLLAVVPAFACIWDRDTLSAEAIGLPEVVDVIVGRFDRPPAKYYEMRLETVTARLLREPDNWVLYDDAGAAADRLHRGDEAIGWMERKRVSLKRVGTDDANHREHTYRYHANVGTFHAHRWLRAGARRDRLDDLKLARQHIAEAIRLNPQAHFGRERYQLMAIEWLLESPDAKKDARAASLFWVARDRLGPVVVGRAGANLLGTAGYDDAVRGLTGLIVLGDAWQSVDIHLALAQALNDKGNIAAAHLAALRARALIDSGKRSLLPGNDDIISGKITHNSPYVSLGRYFVQASDAAESWQQYRTRYIQDRLDAGRHPDSDTEFWKDYVDPPALRLQVREKPMQLGKPIVGAVAGLIALYPLFGQWRGRRNILAGITTEPTDENTGRKSLWLRLGLGKTFCIVFWLLGLLVMNGSGPGWWLLMASPVLATGTYWAGARVMGLQRWSGMVALRHLGYAAVVWVFAIIALQFADQRPNYHVESKLESANPPTLGTGL